MSYNARVIDGWHVRWIEYHGTPIGLFTIIASKGSRTMRIEKADAHRVETFDPETEWKSGKR